MPSRQPEHLGPKHLEIEEKEFLFRINFEKRGLFKCLKQKNQSSILVLVKKVVVRFNSQESKQFQFEIIWRILRSPKRV